METGDCFTGVNQPGGEEDQSPSPRAKIKNVWSYASTPLYDFMSLRGQIYLQGAFGLEHT